MNHRQHSNALRLAEAHTAAAVAARDAGAVTDGWQPIETAPKDGSRFLAAEGDSVFPCTWYRHSAAQGHWMNPDDGSPISRMFDEFDPTHWMPLPPPPESDL